jgi:hypothetical protein
VKRLPTRLLHALCLAAACLLPQLAVAQKQTVCTITINSPDEQKVFRRFLPEDKYDFVELVGRNRSNWLASACEAKVSCDMLVISGHYGEGNEFFSDVMEIRESLSIGELERVSCSGSCPSLFSRLKEVYLFGCDTLNPQPQRPASAEIPRSLQREGLSASDASRVARLLNAERGESSRDRMRLVFKDVPVIYGFSSAAPLGPVAATSLNRFFQAGGAAQVGKGHVSGGLLRQFSAQGMVAARGMTAGDALAGMRKDVCMFADDRLTQANRLDGLHELLQRPTAQSRMLLDRIERFTATLDPATRAQPAVTQALHRIASDTPTRERFLAFARDADEARTRARMINVAHGVGWLSGEQRVDELGQMFGELLGRKSIEGPDVDLACTLNKDGALKPALQRVAAAAGKVDGVAHSAILACMGSPEAHERTLEALVSPVDNDVRIAQTYLRHRPIADASALRALTRAIASMNGPEAQARALDTLGRHYVSDKETIGTLQQLFAKTRSWQVQNAIAGVLIRADADALGTPELLRTLREYRLKASPGDNMVDALIQRLQLS